MEAVIDLEIKGDYNTPTGSIKEFIINQGTGDWTNIADIQKDPDGNPAASSNWRDQYDIYSTPVIYLLDKDKKILAKRISYKQISKIIERLEQ